MTDGICAANSIECANNATISGQLSVSSPVTYGSSSAAPVNGSTAASRSEGIKMVLFLSFSYTQADYAIGIEP